MKTKHNNPFKKQLFLIVQLLVIVFLAFSCSKKKGGGVEPDIPIDSTQYKFKITATRITTAPRNPVLTNEAKMCFGNNKFYTFERGASKFMSYDLILDEWTVLTHSHQLDFAGYTGKMLYMPDHYIYYLHGYVDVYVTFDHFTPSLRNKWDTYRRY